MQQSNERHSISWMWRDLISIILRLTSFRNNRKLSSDCNLRGGTVVIIEIRISVLSKQPYNYNMELNTEHAKCGDFTSSVGGLKLPQSLLIKCNSSLEASYIL